MASFRAIEDISVILVELLLQLHERTGWCWGVIGGGPAPDDDDRVETLS